MGGFERSHADAIEQTGPGSLSVDTENVFVALLDRREFDNDGDLSAARPLLADRSHGRRRRADLTVMSTSSYK